MAPPSTRSTAEKIRGRDLVIVSLPAIALLLLGAVLSQVIAPGYFLDAITSVLLTLPPVLITVWLTLRLYRRHPAGSFLGMLAGVVLKASFAIGGGGVLFFGTEWYTDRGASLWIWISVAYLATLAVEIVTMTRLLRNSNATREG